MACSHDTDGDGNCGQPACPECGAGRSVEPPAAALEGIEAVQGIVPTGNALIFTANGVDRLRQPGEQAGTPVDRFLAMSPQARWALKKAMIFTLEAAAARSDEELLAIVGFGESSLVKLRAWQEDPSVIQAGVRATAPDPREDRIFGLYACLRGAGHTKEKARELAVAEVDALSKHLRGEQ